MSVFTDMDTALFVNADLGEDGSYTTIDGCAEPFLVRAIVERDLAIIGEWGELRERRTEILLQKSELSHPPRRGDSLTVGTETWTIERVLRDDGLVVRVAAHE